MIFIFFSPFRNIFRSLSRFSFFIFLFFYIFLILRLRFCILSLIISRFFYFSYSFEIFICFLFLERYFHFVTLTRFWYFRYSLKIFISLLILFSKKKKIQKPWKNKKNISFVKKLYQSRKFKQIIKVLRTHVKILKKY